MKPLRAVLLLMLGVAVLAGAGGIVLVRRGFRATATPSAWETVLARRVRNLAIPARERSEKNPVAADPDNARLGRDAFLSECAGCHGIDGGGKTPMGVGLYPRVPDLRADATQNLTDGEIHYIIENGVQLTGMPGWGKPHRESSAKNWTLVSFIRSLRPLDRQEQARQTETASASV